MDEVEELLNRGGSGEVSNTDSTTCSSVDGTGSSLEGNEGMLRLPLIGESDHKTMIGRCFYLEVTHLVVV